MLGETLALLGVNRASFATHSPVRSGGCGDSELINQRDNSNVNRCGSSSHVQGMRLHYRTGRPFVCRMSCTTEER